MIVCAPGAGQIHLAVATARGFVHADAGLRTGGRAAGAGAVAGARRVADDGRRMMATLILTTVGTLVGGPIGGAVGALLGQAVDSRLFAPKARQGPRLGDLSVQTSTYGSEIPKLFGTMRVAGTVIWATDLKETRSTTGNGKGQAKSVNYTYSASASRWRCRRGRSSACGGSGPTASCCAARRATSRARRGSGCWRAAKGRRSTR